MNDSNSSGSAGVHCLAEPRNPRFSKCTLQDAESGPCVRHASDLKMAHSRRTMHLPLHDDSRPPHTTYSAGAGSPLGLRSLSGHQRADVAIVGGGIAGCSAALHAAEAGARVVLVEANEIGWGASSRNARPLPPAPKHDTPEGI